MAEYTTPLSGNNSSGGDSGSGLEKRTAAAKGKSLPLENKAREWKKHAAYILQHIDVLEEDTRVAFNYIYNSVNGKTIDAEALTEKIDIISQAAANFVSVNKDLSFALGKFASSSNNLRKNFEAFRECVLKDTSSSDTPKKEVAPVVGGTSQAKQGKPEVQHDKRIIGGVTWEGWFAGDIPVREGKITFRPNVWYEGGWNENGPQGKGVLHLDGDVWTAQFVDGDPIRGEIKYKDGSVYEGDLNEDGPHGRGRRKCKDWTETGEYRDGKRFGKGRIEMNNGSWYEGEWNENGAHGYGTNYVASYKRRDIGQYRDGNRVGRGRMEWESGEWYEGGWNEHGAHGKGKYRYSGGQINEGDFVDGNRKGFGRITFPNGDIYEGSWREDEQGRLYGEGKYTWAGGRQFEHGRYVAGSWVSNASQRYQQTTSYTAPSGGGSEEVTTWMTIRNVIAWVMTLFLGVSALGAFFSDGETWQGLIGIPIFTLLAHWIYAGTGDGRTEWKSPASIMGWLYLVCGGIYVILGLFVSGWEWYFVIGGGIWIYVGLMGIGLASDD